MLRKLLAFYLVPNGPISFRDAVSKIILPIAAVWVLAQVFPALKIPVLLVFWPMVLLILIIRFGMKLRNRKRDRAVGFNDGPSFLWLHQLIAILITVMGFTLGAATVWAIPIAIVSLAYGVIVQGLRKRRRSRGVGVFSKPEASA